MNNSLIGFSKNKIILKQSSKMAIFVSIILCLITVFDKIVLKGAINFYIHTPVTYIIIFFLQFFVVRDEWENIKHLYKIIQKQFLKKNLFKLVVILLPFFLAILFKNKLNEYLLNQNIFGLEYQHLQFIMQLKFYAKTVVLYGGSLLTALLANYLNFNQIKVKRNHSDKKQFVLIAVVLTILFLAVKAFFIFYYSGNFQDDWHHIVAGQNFFQDGTFLKINQYFGDEGYQRGAYMTILTNLFMYLFGRDVDIAQLAPAFIGLINFVLLILIARKVLKSNISIILLSLLYVFNPFVIFNHLFIRMYVFYELFFLLIILFCIYLYRNLLVKEHLQVGLCLLSLALLNAFIWKYTGDKSSILFPIYSLIGVFIATHKSNFLKPIVQKILSLIQKHRWVFIFIAAIVIPLAIFFFTKFSIWNVFVEITTSNTNAGSNRASLIRLICYTFAPLVMYVFLSFTGIGKHSVSKQILISFAFLSLVTHIALPETYQVIRGFNYTWGVLLIVAVMLREEFMTFMTLIIRNKVILCIAYTVFALLLLIPTIKSYSNYFFSVGPSIVGEVAYYEFDVTFKYLSENKSKKLYIGSSYNAIPDIYYNLPVKYYLDLDKTLAESSYFPEEIKLISSIQEVHNLSLEEDVCVVLRDYSPGLLVQGDFMTYLVNNYSLNKVTNGWRIWCERSNQTKLP